MRKDLSLNKEVRDTLERSLINRKIKHCRIAVTDRCLSVAGKTMNLQTGFIWNYISSEEIEEDTVTE